MAEKCSCGQSAHGSVGMLVLCRACVSRITGLPEKKCRKPVRIELQSGGRVIGHTEWLPWRYQLTPETRAARPGEGEQ